MRVRRHIWPKPGQSRTTYYDGERWVPCQNLDVARGIARKHGYAGIKIEPM